MEIRADNIHDALARGISVLLAHGQEELSRNGPVLVAPEPVITVYTNPTRRVLTSTVRDANPFFHLMEALWMLAGRNDIAFPKYFNQKFGEYSDDGVTAPGAYGYRWKKYFTDERQYSIDQLDYIQIELTKNPESRRAGLVMWDTMDLVRVGTGTKDAPCNMTAVFERRRGVLDLNVFCRSNDIIWGCYGANAVQFSILLEYMAARLDVPVGVYRQISVNFHAYLDVYPRDKLLEIQKECSDISRRHRKDGYPKSVPLMKTDTEEWNANLTGFFDDKDNPYTVYSDPFFMFTVRPMYECWKQRKEKAGNGLAYAEQIQAEDWREACVEWIQRRMK